MNVIFNDFSIDEQFDNTEDFVDSICENTLPSMEYIEKLDGFLLLKSNSIFHKNICKDINFGVFLGRHSFGFPELLKFKSLLVQLINEPYWEEDLSTDDNALYHCDIIGDFEGKDPNCFSEALERKYPLLSLYNKNFCELTIAITKNSKTHFIANIFNKESVCEHLFLQSSIGFSDYLLSKKYPLQIRFLKNDNNEYYADSCFLNSTIVLGDIKGIADTFERHIAHLHTGTKSSLTKSITHKGITYFEFRDKLSNHREFRIFYFRTGKTLIYLNSHLKKTQKTPDTVKDYSVKLIKEYIIS